MPHTHYLSVFIFVFIGLFTRPLQAQEKPTAEEIKRDTLLALQLQDSADARALANLPDEEMQFLVAASRLIEQALGKESQMYARSLLKQALVFNDMGKIDSAEIKVQAVQEVFPGIPGDTRVIEAGIYHVLGDIHRVQQQYEAAIRYWEKALAIRLAFYGADHPYIPSYYNNLAVLYQYINNNDKALEYYKKALDISKKIYGDESYDAALAYANIGGIYMNLEAYDQAIFFLKAGVDIMGKILGEEHPQVADIHYIIGNLFFNKQNYEEALSYFQKVCQIRIKAFGAEHPQVADAYLKMANMLYAKENYEDALTYCEKALIANGFKNHRYKDVYNLQYLSYTLGGIGNTYFAMYQKSADKTTLHKARLYFLESIEAIDTLRNTFTESDTKQILIQNNYTLYEDILGIELLLYHQTDSVKYLQEAFQYTSFIKSQLLYEALREADALHFAGIPDSLLQEEYNIRLNITSNEELKEALLNGVPSETNAELLATNATLLNLKQTYENLKKRFIKDYPDYYTLKYNQEAISATEVQKKLLRPNQAMLEYFVGDSSIFIFVLRPDTLVMQEVKKNFPLEDWVSSLRDNIYKNRTTGAVAYAEAAYNLYQKLILPVKSLLPEQVIIIPDGILGYVPFEALLTEKPERAIRFNSHAYLLKEHQISYCYSATLLREMQQKKSLKNSTGTLLAVAPFYTGDTTLLANLFAYDETTRKDLAPLQHSGEEVYRISKLWKGEVLTGADATEEKFTSQAGNYKILHLATHGRADERVGNYSFLAFSEIKDSVENELLYVRDLYNMQLNADLVVLSACETGLGKLSRGEGIISLARAFAYAGAKSIVTTLWSVDDAKTKDVMVDFYRNLKKGMTKDAALRQAKLDYLISHSNPVDAHPFYWSGFAPIGDMRALPK